MRHRIFTVITNHSTVIRYTNGEKYFQTKLRGLEVIFTNSRDTTINGIGFTQSIPILC